MTQKTYLFLLKFALKFGILFMAAEATIHFTNIRLLNLEKYWPPAALLLLEEFMYLWAAACVFFALVLFYLHQNLDSRLIKYVGYFSLFLALVILYISRIPYEDILPTSASHFWIPFYHIWSRVEAVILILYSFFIGFGFHHKYLNS